MSMPPTPTSSIKRIRLGSNEGHFFLLVRPSAGFFFCRRMFDIFPLYSKEVPDGPSERFHNLSEEDKAVVAGKERVLVES